jgi:hypothetical protein
VSTVVPQAARANATLVVSTVVAVRRALIDFLGQVLGLVVSTGTHHPGAAADGWLNLATA